MAKWDSLKLRIITAVILFLLLAGITTQLPPFSFALVIAIVVLRAGWEWTRFLDASSTQGKLLYLGSLALMIAGIFGLLGITPTAVEIDELRAAMLLGLGQFFWLFTVLLLRGYPANKDDWNDDSHIAAMGLFALLPVLVAIVLLKYLLPNGALVLGLVVLVAAVDVGAYFTGTRFGHRKLAPALSPNKSWEGVWGGLVLCLLLAVAMTWALDTYLLPLSAVEVALMLLLACFVTLFSVIGDLMESMLKRNCDLKDSGSILPGHGGLLDRVDGLMAAAPSFALVFLIVINRSEAL